MSEIVSELKALKLHGMSDCYAELGTQGQLDTIEKADWLIKHLIDAETTDRATRSIGYQMGLHDSRSIVALPTSTSASQRSSDG